MMVFPYAVERRGQPILSLGGRTDRPRPLIPVTIVGPLRSMLRTALLDTGADDTVFPESYAAFLGIDLTGAPVGQLSSVTMQGVPIRFVRVPLRLATRHERRQWHAWVGFTDTIRRPVLGYAGCLQFFDAHFRGALRQVELTVNDSYPGT